MVDSCSQWDPMVTMWKIMRIHEYSNTMGFLYGFGPLRYRRLRPPLHECRPDGTEVTNVIVGCY